MLGISKPVTPWHCFSPLTTEADAILVEDLFSTLVENELCSPPCFVPAAERLDDTVIDCPQAFELMTMIMKGSAMDKDWRCYGRITAKSKHSNGLIALLL